MLMLVADSLQILLITRLLVKVKIEDDTELYCEHEL